MSLVSLGRKAQRINIQKLALEEAKANSELIAELNRQQLTVGENSNEKAIGELKSKKYAKDKKSRGGFAPLGVPDLNFSGNLHDKIKVGIFPTQILINSLVDYSKYQVRRYGKEIFNLQDQNWEEIEFRILVETRKKYLKQIGL